MAVSIVSTQGRCWPSILSNFCDMHFSLGREKKNYSLYITSFGNKGCQNFAPWSHQHVRNSSIIIKASNPRHTIYACHAESTINQQWNMVSIMKRFEKINAWLWVDFYGNKTGLGTTTAHSLACNQEKKSVSLLLCMKEWSSNRSQNSALPALSQPI